MIDYLSQHLWQMWAVVAVVCLILELTAGDFFIMCFSIGAVFATICAAVGGNFYWQLAVFALFTIISLFLVRPFALRYLHKNEEHRVSNADALLGRRGRVVETIEAGGYGRVAIDGDVWKAVSVDKDEIPAGTYVRVTNRESIIITVKSEE
ncbi:MAG: NfeD family protein [Prevotella sp.]|nr:NfeD family protein [Prevotella sp.]